jgi:hypothetical protein
VSASRYSSQIGLDSIISKEEELLFVLPRTNRDRKNKKRWWRYCFERGADGSILYLEWERRENGGSCGALRLLSQKPGWARSCLFAASSLVWVCLGLGRGGLSFFWVRTVESVGGADGKEARPGEASASARVGKPSERLQGMREMAGLNYCSKQTRRGNLP